MPEEGELEEGEVIEEEGEILVQADPAELSPNPVVVPPTVSRSSCMQVYNNLFSFKERA